MRSSFRPIARSPSAAAQAGAVYDHIEIDPSPIRNKIREIIGQYEHRFDDLDREKDENLGRIESGDDVDPGIIKQVKVYIASKQALGR